MPIIDTGTSPLVAVAKHRLVLAEILYRIPDHPSILQTFLWQDFDIAPKFPALSKFLNFWEQNLDGPLHSVRIAQKSLLTEAGVRHSGTEFRLH